MKRLIFLCFVFNFVFAHSQDELNNALSLVNKDSIYYNAQQLESFQTRFSFADNHKQVTNYLVERMNNYGFEVSIDSFYADSCQVFKDSLFFSGWQYNISCLKRATRNLSYDTCVVIGAHYDCISNREGFLDYMHYAPGADDNGSGVACLIELARVWNEAIRNQNYNLRIEFFDCEEQNLTGSDHRMRSLSNPWKMNIIGMINLDMVGSDSTNTVAINYYDNCDLLTDVVSNSTNKYTDLNIRYTQDYIKRSDSWPFYSWGVPSVFITESDFSPYYHTLQDSAKNLNYPYMSKITKIAIGTLYELLNNFPKVSLTNAISPNINLFTSNNNLIIRTNNIELKHLAIIDILGNIIEEKAIYNQRESISINNLKSGIYIVRITTKDNIYSTKIIK